MHEAGSGFLLSLLASARRADAELCIDALQQDALTLVQSGPGGAVVQALFDLASPAQVSHLIGVVLRGSYVQLSLHAVGCRVVQRVLQAATPAELALIASELAPHVLKCIDSQHGNHVIQRCVELMPPSMFQFVVDAIGPMILDQSRHAFGCRVVQRVLRLGSLAQTGPLQDVIFANVHMLVCDQFGNYVCQSIAQHGSEVQRARLVAPFAGLFVSLSMQKSASNVLESCMAHCSADMQHAFIEEMLRPHADGRPAVVAMARDPFANYVVQRALDVASPADHALLLAALHEHMALLTGNSYAKRVVARLLASDGIK